MKQWFPLTDYDFYACLTAGALLIVLVDYSFFGGVLLYRDNWTFIAGTFWVAISYLVGHIIAGPSAAILEHLVARRILKPPSEILLGLRLTNWFERALGVMLGISEYRPFPEPIRKRILAAARKKVGLIATDEIDAETVFAVAFPVARSTIDSATRLDNFQNLYGMSRNVAFVALIGIFILSWLVWRQPTSAHAFALAASAVGFIGFFGRFLKFYACFSAQVFRAYLAAAD